MRAKMFMYTGYRAIVMIAGVLVSGSFTACTQKIPSVAGIHKHEHVPPHQGTPVVLGLEAYHLELVREPSTGKMQAYIFDGEMEDFVRSSAPSFELATQVGGVPQTLVFLPVANSATGETVGDTALFEAQADWLKTTSDFDATLKNITIHGSSFSDVKFSFPAGNDDD